MRNNDAGQLELDLWGTAGTDEPAWRVALYGPPLSVHDPRCWLDPRHHFKTACSWPADPELARTIEYERVLRLTGGVLDLAAADTRPYPTGGADG